MKNSENNLVSRLQALDPDKDRGTLAMLRASVQRGRELEALSFVLPCLGERRGARDEDDAILLASLYGLHPHRGSQSLATALKIVRDETGSDSIELRFKALLSADREELPVHLRHAVALVASNDIPIDWRDLYRAIRYWDADLGANAALPRSHVRRKWARDFWSPDSGNASTTATEQKQQETP